MATEPTKKRQPPQGMKRVTVLVTAEHNNQLEQEAKAKAFIVPRSVGDHLSSKIHKHLSQK